MNTNKCFCENFWSVYKRDIEPKLEHIDILLKSEEERISISEAADALSMSECEIVNIVEEQDIDSITKDDFLKIMSSGNSYICELYKRELECGSPYIYTSSHIAYIYGIDINEVNDACVALGISQITQGVLPLIFAQIKVYKL